MQTPFFFFFFFFFFPSFFFSFLFFFLFFFFFLLLFFFSLYIFWLDYFIPPDIVEMLNRKAQWDETSDAWIIPRKNLGRSISLHSTDSWLFFCSFLCSFVFFCVLYFFVRNHQITHQNFFFFSWEWNAGCTTSCVGNWITKTRNRLRKTSKKI